MQMLKQLWARLTWRRRREIELLESIDAKLDKIFKVLCV